MLHTLVSGQGTTDMEFDGQPGYMEFQHFSKGVISKRLLHYVNPVFSCPGVSLDGTSRPVLNVVTAVGKGEPARSISGNNYT